MITALIAYIKTITALTIFSALTELLLPESRQRRYAQLILGIFVLMAVLHPLFRLMGSAQQTERAVQTEWEWRYSEKAWEWLDTYNDKKYE